jgi:hypothetical protein
VNIALRGLNRTFRREFRLDAKYYYEMDVRVDAPFLIDLLPVLFNNGEPNAARSGARRRGFWAARWRQLEPLRRWLTGNHELDATNIDRNSYRVERLEKSEALHKIYVEARIWVGRFRRLHVVLVYELLFHRPAREHDYILKELRVVSAHSKELSQTHIVRLKHIVAERFVNPCLEEGWRLNIPEPDDAGDSFDALFTVTRLPARDTNGAERSGPSMTASPQPSATSAGSPADEGIVAAAATVSVESAARPQ